MAQKNDPIERFLRDHAPFPSAAPKDELEHLLARLNLASHSKAKTSWFSRFRSQWIFTGALGSATAGFLLWAILAGFSSDQTLQNNSSLEMGLADYAIDDAPTLEVGADYLALIAAGP